MSDDFYDAVRKTAYILRNADKIKIGDTMELEVLKTAISNILKVDPNEITEETTFLGDLGADSLDVYQIVSGVEEELNITITAEDVEKITNVGEAVEVITKAEQNAL